MSDEPVKPALPLTDEEQLVLRKQFGDSYVQAQETYDSSVRALAAAGVAVTVTIGTAIEDFTGAAVVAVLLFLVSLASNLVSFATAQRDLRLRLEAVWKRDRRAVMGNAWTKWTARLNFLAGLTLVLGGGCLAYYVGTTA